MSATTSAVPEVILDRGAAKGIAVGEQRSRGKVLVCKRRYAAFVGMSIGPLSIGAVTVKLGDHALHCVTSLAHPQSIGAGA
jgi:hypothetical protein